MSRLYYLLTGLVLALCIASCCTSKKPATPPPATEALPDRNTRDPKLNNDPPKLELKDSV